MSWIDEEFKAERRSASGELTKQERESHRAKLIEAKGRELWDMLRKECRKLVQEYKAKCGDDLRCTVRFDESDPDSLYVQMENIPERPRASVRLRLNGYQIHVQHITWLADPSSIQKVDSYFAFECDGLGVSLSSAGTAISLPAAGERILKPVLFSK